MLVKWMSTVCCVVFTSLCIFCVVKRVAARVWICAEFREALLC